jgi:hypothetical protein
LRFKYRTEQAGNPQANLDSAGNGMTLPAIRVLNPATYAEPSEHMISSKVGVGIPGFQVGSRSSSIFPEGSRK